jgi:ligand-binding SRPBCC domain-containing protein
MREQVVPGTLEHVFAFFERAENLHAITPPRQRFEILTPLPISMRVGARIEYRLRAFGLRLRWMTEITEYDPPHGFVDVQLRGPYAHWTHRHAFERIDGERVRMTDCVDYALPLWPLSALGGAQLVARELDSIFDYRRDAIARLIGVH